jgi:hypothetical protein
MHLDATYVAVSNCRGPVTVKLYNKLAVCQQHCEKDCTGSPDGIIKAVAVRVSVVAASPLICSCIEARQVELIPSAPISM